MIVRDDEKVKKIIAENIVRYRRECNLTQAELAEKIHYSDKSVSKWERADGVPDIFVLVMLAELFGVTVNDLLTEKRSNGIDLCTAGFVECWICCVCGIFEKSGQGGHFVRRCRGFGFPAADFSAAARFF